MLPTKMVVHHFRAIRDCSIELTDYTALVGQNGAGKSTILEALRFFFEPSRAADHDDLNHEFEDEIAVAVTLAGLSEREKELYAEVLSRDGTLTVTKRSVPGEAPYFTIHAKTYAPFATLRRLFTAKATVFTQAYKDFVAQHQHLDLAIPRSSGDQKLELRRWELDHPEQLEESDLPFVFPDATKTDLIPTTRVLYVPAVHEAAEDFEGTRSILARMIDVIVMPRIEQNPDFIALQEKLNDEYKNLFEEALARELEPLASLLTRSLNEYVPGATVSLDWQEATPHIRPPEVRSSITDDGPPTPIERQGHGLQRAVIMALLQTYDEYARTRDSDKPGEATHICLLIEEPELYQHPPRARHFRRLLRRLATTPTDDAQFRVIVTTHSPDFVSLNDIADIRLIRRAGISSQTIQRREIAKISVAEICERYKELTAEELAPSDVERNLHVLEPLKEAFFATSIVLTEGPSDVGVLAAACRHESVDFEAHGMVFAAMGGKGVLRQAIVIVRLLGIRAYVIFDGDTKERWAEDRRLLKLLEATEEDIPRPLGTPPELIRSTYAMLQKDMESTLERDFGSAYKECERETASAFGMLPQRVSKNPASAEFLVELLYARGLDSPTLRDIVAHLGKL